ncbi:sterol desaturase family protein [Tenacibaculum sp. M341]|uniref:sterol desaturase family protein n=1 Tax=Tenacibaculum sp. M341 TaxID=2530339 RepID=UPI00104737C3|nr:sterol desaturase family protein [Tenacibaculum sp. M341]TCI92789.1 sterol desaturase family protein [Tenacibaculum sp. M341]
MSFSQLISLLEESPIMTYIVYFFIFNTSIVAIEIIVDLITHKKRRWKDSMANFCIFLINQLLEKTIVGSIGIIALMPFHYLTPLAINETWWSWILAILAADFTYYWMHRIEHEHRILWGNHSVHHSSEDYNLTISFRLSIIEPMIEWIFLIPMILIGFSPFQAIVGLIFVAQYQTWIHTERINKLGWLDWIFNTPSVHRVHHGSNTKYLDKNYGGITMIWDHLFGTYQKEEEKVIYGLTKPIKTNNPIKINFIEYMNIWEDVKKCRTFKDKLRIIFGDLIWKPSYFKQIKKETK